MEPRIQSSKKTVVLLITLILAITMTIMDLKQRIKKRQMDPMDYLKQSLIEPLDFSKDELSYLFEKKSSRALTWLTKEEIDSKEIDQNLFFLKSSKTGGTTVLSILQRFGMHYGLDFLIGEGTAGLYHNARPFSLEDCWIGKYDKSYTFNISANHLHWNKSAIDSLMAKPYKRIAVVREPESQFISSYTFYHGSLFHLANALNPNAEYLRYNKKHPEYRRPEPGQESRRETTADLEYEIEKFLTRPYDFIHENDPADIEGGWWGWMATIRPQLLFFGVSPNGEKSWDENLTRSEVLLWFRQLIDEFDLFLITEDMDRSLAFAHLEFGIPIDDLLNVAVNQANDYHAKPTMSTTTRLNLRNLNWPDFLLHKIATTLRDMKIDHYTHQYGYDIVQEVGDEIRRRSEQLASECIANDEKMSHDFGRKIVHLREEKMSNRTCMRMIFQGPSTSKYFQVFMIDRLKKKNQGVYKTCGKKVVFGKSIYDFKRWSVPLRNEFREMSGEYEANWS